MEVHFLNFDQSIYDCKIDELWRWKMLQFWRNSHVPLEGSWSSHYKNLIEAMWHGKKKIVVHASHLVQSYNFQKNKLGFKPFFVVQVKQTRWTTVKYKGNDYEMLRKSNRAIWSLCLFRFWWRLIKKLCTLDYKYSVFFKIHIF